MSIQKYWKFGLFEKTISCPPYQKWSPISIKYSKTLNLKGKERLRQFTEKSIYFFASNIFLTNDLICFYKMRWILRFAVFSMIKRRKSIAQAIKKWSSVDKWWDADLDIETSELHLDIWWIKFEYKIITVIVLLQNPCKRKCAGTEYKTFF